MDSGVGTPGNSRFNSTTQNRLESVLQLTLDRSQPRLPGVPAEPGAFVGQVETVSGHQKIALNTANGTPRRARKITARAKPIRTDTAASRV